MAEFHESISIIGRSDGRCSVQMAAYISGDKLYDERTGLTIDQTSKEEVILSDMVFAERVPNEIRNISSFWNSVEQNEKHPSAQLSRVMEIAFPIELNQSQCEDLIKDYVKSLIEDDKIPAVQYAIHWKEGNPHAHLMMPMRDIDDNGQWKSKQKREYILTERGDKIPVLDEEKLAAYKEAHGEDFNLEKIDKELYSRTDLTEEERKAERQKILDEVQKLRVRKSRGTVERKWQDQTTERSPWDDKEMVITWRARWAEKANMALERAGFDERIDHRSYAERGIDKVPTIHEGYAARQMGDLSARVQHNQEVQKRNQEIQALSRNIIEQQTLLERLIQEFKDFIEEVSHHGISRAITDRIARLGSRSNGRTDRDDPGLVRELGTEEPGLGTAAIREYLDKQRADEEKQRTARAEREAEQERLRTEERARAERAEQERIRAEQELARKPKKTRSQSHDEGMHLR